MQLCGAGQGEEAGQPLGKLHHVLQADCQAGRRAEEQLEAAAVADRGKLHAVEAAVRLESV